MPDPDQAGSDDASRGRDVIVPLRLYKTVTVFSTLIAIVGFVGGFMLLDHATRRARVPLNEIDPALAILGLGLIVAGSAVWIYGARFHPPGMGKPNDQDDHGSDDG